MPQDVKAFNNDDMIMLTPDGKKAIDACIMRSKSAWSIIKEIAITKYNEYLTALEATCNTKNRQTELDSIVKRWKTDGSNQEFLNSKEFDSDLSYVLKAVAQRLHGLSTEFMNLEPYIRNWHTNRSIDRRTAFIISIGFGFNIEETRKLLYNVLEDDEQMDFNPRLPNELIYSYAIIRNVPLTAKSEKESVSTLLHEAQTRFLMSLFGNEYSGYFDDLIHVADDSFNLLDSLNMTRSAFSLAIIIYIKENKFSSENTSLILEALMEENVFSTTGIAELFSIIIENNKFEKAEVISILATLVTKNQITRRKDINAYAAILKKNNILSKQDVEELLKVFNNQQAKPQKKTDTKKTCKMIPSSSIAQMLYEKVFFIGASCASRDTPNHDKAKKSKESYLLMLESAIRYLNVAIEKGEGLDIELYKSVLEFVQKAKEYVSNEDYGKMLSPIDFLPLLENSKFCDFDQFSSKLKSFLIEKFIQEALPIERNEERDMNAEESSGNNDENKFDSHEYRSRSSDYHPTFTMQLITKEQEDYFEFVWKSLISSAKYLRVLSERKIRFFWSVYVSMEKILTFPFLDKAGLAYRFFIENKRKEERLKNSKMKSKDDNRFDIDQDTLTVEQLRDIEDAADNCKNGQDFVRLVMNSLHSYEYFNNMILSRGKEMYILQLEKKGTLTSLGLTADNQSNILQVFYNSNRFSKQFYNRSEQYTRSDILKLAFWDWISQEDHLAKSPKLRKVDFTKHFDRYVAPETCCGVINTNNSMDQFLLLCITQDDPIEFLKAAIVYLEELKAQNPRMRTIF